MIGKLLGGRAHGLVVELSGGRSGRAAREGGVHLVLVPMHAAIPRPCPRLETSRSAQSAPRVEAALAEEKGGSEAETGAERVAALAATGARRQA